MQCNQAITLLDDYLDDMLSTELSSALTHHLHGCPACSQELADRQELIANLRSIPVAQSSPGFAARALRHSRTHSHVRKGFVAGFGTALAAALVVWITAGPMNTATAPDSPIAEIALQVEESRTISLAFNSPEDVEQVTFALQLPDGVSLAGQPEQSRVIWQDQLQRGKNVLKLTLVGKQTTHGELVASITQADQKRVFRVPLKVQGKKKVTSTNPVTSF